MDGDIRHVGGHVSYHREGRRRQAAARPRDALSAGVLWGREALQLSDVSVSTHHYLSDLPMPYPDAAAFGDLSVLARLTEELDRFNAFEGPDPAGRNRAAWTEHLGTRLPQEGAGLEAVLEDLRKWIVPNGLRNGHPGFSGWVTTSPTTSGTAAALASTVAGSQRVWVHTFNYLEKLSLDWLKQLLGFPENWHGTYTTGGSSANLIALGAARQWAVEQQGFDPSMTGLPAHLKWRIYASSEVHHVVNRAAAVLGIGRRNVIGVPVNSAGEIDPDALQQRIAADRKEGFLPMAIIATAGTVNTGAIDPIRRLRAIADEESTWLHVDGAYGMFGILDDRVRERYDGVAEADSVALDPHKWMAAPVGNGVAMVRDRDLMGRAFTLEPAAYLEGSMGQQDEVVASPFDGFGEILHEFNLDQSAPSRGVQVWAILREIGKSGMTDRVKRHNGFARHLSALVEKDPYLEQLAPVVLSICCFRYVHPDLDESQLNELNRQLMAALRAEGDLVPSSTILDGKLAIRPCYVNPRTRLEDVDLLATRAREIGDALAQRFKESPTR